MSANSAKIEHSEEDSAAAADAEGRADLDAGRVMTGEAVKRWLRSWDTAEELPAPQIGD